MKFAFSISVICLLLSMAHVCVALTKPDIHYRVKVLVSSEDESTKSEIESHLKRKLRLLNDVDIVTDNPQYTISIISINDTVGERDIGVSISAIFISNYNMSEFKNDFSPKKNTKESLTEYVFDTERKEYKKASLHTGNRDDIDFICGRIAASFDQEILEHDREFAQWIVDRLNEAKGSKKKQEPKPSGL